MTVFHGNMYLMDLSQQAQAARHAAVQELGNAYIALRWAKDYLDNVANIHSPDELHEREAIRIAQVQAEEAAVASRQSAANLQHEENDQVEEPEPDEFLPLL
jgi:prophage DNA circulation protein